VDFAFSEEQLAFRDSVRDMLEKQCPPSAVREAWTNDTGRVPGLWERLCALGVAGDDAAGLAPLDLVLVLEETGRACVPEPLVETFAAALDGAAAVTTGLGLDVSPLVAYADSVDRLVLEHDGALYSLPPSLAGVERRPAVDGSRRLFSVSWDPRRSERLDAPPRAVLDRAALAAAAQLCGLAQHLLDVTVGYAKERRQFGQPIGAFQAVKHHLAGVALKLEFARPLVHRAAYSMDTTHVSMAKAHASEAALLASRVALQVHGAIGYTVEYDLHMWLKRAWALAAAWGDAAWHVDRVGEAILTPR
jgi:alkylation response protein AidB-like acyl-CoA dehydrogenase